MPLSPAASPCVQPVQNNAPLHDVRTQRRLSACTQVETLPNAYITRDASGGSRHANTSVHGMPATSLHRFALFPTVGEEQWNQAFSAAGGVSGPAGQEMVATAGHADAV